MTPLRARRAAAWLVIAALQGAPPGVALAAPEGEQVVSGSADFERSGDLTHITTYTPQTIVTYTGFDIAPHEAVRIDQPDAGSRILNQVMSTDPTQIDGLLSSNGQVWIVNPVGVFFGGRAIVDVGGLVAAAGHVDEGDFLAGNERFSDLAGRVEVASGARLQAVDSVLLVGATVANYGHIAAPDGMIALVAGGEVRLTRVGGRVSITADPALAPNPQAWAVEQAGTVDAGRGSVHLSAGDAYSLAMNHSGMTRGREIEASSGAGGLARIEGTLDASGSTPGETGGRIAVLGDRIWVGAAELDASGDAGGGDIRVGGDAHGAGETPTASRTYVSSDALLRADAGRSGDGGQIVVWADDATRFYGSVSARGGSQGGDGGFAEISGKSLVSRATVDLGAAAGEAGTLLYDPLRIVIQGGTADGSDTNDATPPETFLRGDDGSAGRVAAGDVGDAGEPFVIYESEIEGTDANLVLQATQSIQTQGTFTGNDVAIAAGRDVALSVEDGGADVAPGEIVGIDIASHTGSGDLLWRLSDGGTLMLTTTSSADRDANIAVGAVETSGVRSGTDAAVTILAQGRGSVDVESITTSGADRVGSGQQTVLGNSVDTVAGGNVSVGAETGAVRVGAVEARGGDASALEPGDGGAGGDVSIGALAGPVTVGSVDTSGGDGFVQLVDDGAGGLTPQGSGGDAGAIQITADLDPDDPEADLTGAPRVLTVTGDLLARGGDGLGSASDAGELFGADGGSGGPILLSAGLLADEGEIVVGSASQPVRLDASGGDGTGAGGTAAIGGTSPYSQAPIGAIRIEADGDVTTDARLAATGGRAGFDAGLAANAGPGGGGGSGGDVSLASDTGDVRLGDAGTSFAIVTDGGSGRIDPAAVLDDEGVAHFDGVGGDAGAFAIETSGDGGDIALLGGVAARGGAGFQGDGGAGGDVTLTAADGAIRLADVSLDGGLGIGSVDEGDGAQQPQGVHGGAGGDLTVATQAGTSETAVGGGDLLLAGDVSSVGGAGEPDPGVLGGTPRENHGVGGTVSLTSVKGLDTVGAADAHIQAGTLQLTAVTVGSGGGSGDLVLASTGATSPESFESNATVQGAGDVRVLLDDGDRFARFEVIQTEAAGDVRVERDSGGVIARGVGAAGLHRIDQLDTNAADPHFTYRLADTDPGSDSGEQIDVATLAVAGGAVSFGAKGGTIANARADASQPSGEKLLGGIEGVGSGPHIDSAGGVQVFATHVGDGTPLRVGSAPALEVEVAGNVRMAADAGVDLLDLVQRSAAGDVVIGLPGGGGVEIDGTVADDGASRVEQSRITRADTTGGPDFFFHLSDATASSDEAGTGEPLLSIASGAVTLGGNGGFATTGDLVLEDGPAPAIEAGGRTVVLVADSNLDGAGAIVPSGSGAPDVAHAGALVAYSGSGVGSEGTPLRTSASGADLALSGLGGSGDFQIVNEAGAVTIERIPLTVAIDGAREEVTFRGVAADGDVVLDNQGREIVLGAVQPETPTESVFLRNDAPAIGSSGTQTDGNLNYAFGGLAIPLAAVTAVDPAVTTPHVVSGGSQSYVGSVSLDNARTFASVDPDTGDPVVNSVHEVSLKAGGDVSFEGDVDGAPGSPVPASLDVSSGGVIAIQGDVGSDLGGAPSIASLTLTDATFGAGSQTITTGRGDFGRLDGPGTLALRGVGPDSRLVFRGDIGTSQAPASFDADADLLEFTSRSANGQVVSSADRIVASSISLNATPAASVPEFATIADTNGGLSIESAGDITIGVAQKLSVTGPLAIGAGGTARLGDLAATDLHVHAASILIQGRAAGGVALPNGQVAPDGGVDWAANDIVTNVAPAWDGVGAAPVFVLGSGGILTGTAIPFDAIRFTPHLDTIRPSNLVDAQGRVLDLVGMGTRIVSDPSKDVPRESPTAEPSLQARFSETPPSPPRLPSEEEVLGTVRCRAAGDGLCPPPVSGEGPLYDERTREIVELYHDLVVSAQGRQGLVAAFEPVVRADAVRSGDGRALYRALAVTPAFADARAHLDELAVTLAEVSLLGLDEKGTENVRRAIASDFAAATGVPGLDAETTLEAVDASGVGALPPVERGD